MATASDGLGIYADDANVANARVSVTTHVNKYGYGIATVPRDEFLDAVARELDVIVIPRTDLPEVALTERGGLVAQTDTEVSTGINPASNWTADDARFKALGWLALAEHLENNPPVDEAQVNALARLVAAETNGTHIAATALARRLIQAGVRMDGAK